MNPQTITLLQVRAQVRAGGATVERVRALLLDPTGLATGYDQLDAVTVEPDGSQSWRALLNGSAVDWRQTVRTDGPGVLEFEQVEGDLAVLRGGWTLTGADLVLTIEFHLGVDGLAPLLDPIWTQSLQAFADGLVRHVRDTATAGGSR